MSASAACPEDRAHGRSNAGRYAAGALAPAPGIYVHIPFCRHRCGYCDFPLVAGAEQDLIDRYVAALHRDIARTAAAGPPDGSATWLPFGSVFVGGGTPTLLSPDVLGGVLQALQDALPLAAGAEVTVEANPENLSTAYLREVAGAGLTRLSIGAQSFSTRVLDFLDRDHRPELVPAAVEAARAAGIPSVSMDLMYGAPAERAEDWAQTLGAAVAAGTDHLSCYALTLERGTPYASRVRAGAQPPPEEDAAAARMRTAEHLLEAAGLVRYEVSNWAKPGHASRHNQMYWRMGDYLGFGAGAHGHWHGRRWWNLRSPARYAAAVESGDEPAAGSERLEASQQRLERLLLGLRTVEGVCYRDVAPVDDAAVARLQAQGWLEVDAERLRPTTAGLRFADAMTVELAA